MTEKQFQGKVQRFLSSIGAYHFKVWGGGYQTAGIPDIIACYKGKFIALELKTDIGKPSELQLYNIKKIIEASGYARTLKPSEFEDFKKEILDVT